MLSPNFSYLWPQASEKPAAYDAPELEKIAVFMTDGEFNTSFCNGVVSRISTSGSGSNSDKINCDSPNGSSTAQALEYCTEMKDAGITVYTVGFEISDSQTVRDLLTNCATDAAHAYLASGGAELIAAFRDIGRDISQLRLSH